MGRRLELATNEDKDLLKQLLNHEKFHCYDDIRQWLASLSA
jgi:hypothetical protein